MKFANEIWKRMRIRRKWYYSVNGIFSLSHLEQENRTRETKTKEDLFLSFFFDAISFFDINRVSRERENVQSNQDNALLFSIFENYVSSKRYYQIYSIRNIINIHFLDKLSTNLSFDATMDRWRQIWTRYRNLNTLEPIRYLRAEFVSWPNTDTNDRI